MKTNFKTNRKQISGTILKSFIVIFIIIASANVNGQNFWSLTNWNNDEPVAYNSSNYTLSTETTRSAGFSNWNTLLAKEQEETLELENWMTAEANFGTFVTIEEETEAPLELENWMTSEETFSVNYDFDTETEPELQLEDWMKNESHFQFTTLEEEPLQLEAWMVSANFGVK